MSAKQPKERIIKKETKNNTVLSEIFPTNISMITAIEKAKKRKKDNGTNIFRGEKYIIVRTTS